MRREILNRRMAEAEQRMAAAASALGMDVELSNHRDPDIRRLRLVENIADELERFSGKADDKLSDDERIALVVGDAQAEDLADSGFGSIEVIRNASDDDLDDVDGVGPATIAKLRESFGSA